MEIEHSQHWARKRQHRPDISDAFIEYAVANSDALRDKHWEDALNAISRIPPSGRILKVVYKRTGKNSIKVITAFWLS